MKNLKLLFIGLVLSSASIFGQGVITVKSGVIHKMGTEELGTIELNTLLLEDDSQLLVKNTIIKVKHFHADGDYRIFLNNSLIIWSEYSNVHGDLVSKQSDKNTKLKYYLKPSTKVLKVFKGDKLLAIGSYKKLKEMFVAQGIYNVYHGEKLIDILTVE